MILIMRRQGVGDNPMMTSGRSRGGRFVVRVTLTGDEGPYAALARGSLCFKNIGEIVDAGDSYWTTIETNDIGAIETSGVEVLGPLSPVRPRSLVGVP